MCRFGRSKEAHAHNFVGPNPAILPYLPDRLLADQIRQDFRIYRPPVAENVGDRLQLPKRRHVRFAPVSGH